VSGSEHAGLPDERKQESNILAAHVSSGFFGWAVDLHQSQRVHRRKKDIKVAIQAWRNLAWSDDSIIFFSLSLSLSLSLFLFLSLSFLQQQGIKS
jgi:hypothetical protein